MLTYLALENLPVFLAGGFFAFMFGAATYYRFYDCDHVDKISGKKIPELGFIREVMSTYSVTEVEWVELKRQCDHILGHYKVSELMGDDKFALRCSIYLEYCPKCKTILDPRAGIISTLSKALNKIREAHIRVSVYEDSKTLLDQIDVK